jgi:hypothetical protein
MSDYFYPPQLTPDVVWALKSLKNQIQENPDILDSTDCTYAEEDRVFLAELLGGVLVHVEAGDVVDEDIEQETLRLYEELKTFGKGLDPDDNSERNTYFRLSVSLLEKLLTLQERAVGIKQFKEFKEAVITILEDQLDPSQRTEFIEKLKESTQ